jgi:predicted nucleic acid-binding protein
LQRVVIDTNVLIAANARSTHATASCSAECARALLRIQSECEVVEDIEGSVFLEYKRYCNFDGQPGVGDLFFLWFINSRATNRVVRISIGNTQKEHQEAIHSDLHSFDPSDLKWIALYVLGSAIEIINALDSDWRNSSALLSAHSVTVTELCPN